LQKSDPGADLPSWFTAEPRTIARSPAVLPTSSAQMSMAMTPSPRTYPSAAESNTWQRPCGDSMDACDAAARSSLEGLDEKGFITTKAAQSALKKPAHVLSFFALNLS
jgi:hypothetical protein